MAEKRLSIKGNIFWNSIGSIVYMATQWLITVLTVRMSGVTVAGDLNLAISVNNIFYSIALFGIRNYQVSDVENKHSDSTYISSRYISCGFSLLACVIYAFIMQYAGVQKMCILAYCLFKMSEALYDVYAGICQKHWRMDYIGMSWMIKGIVTFCGYCLVLKLTDSLFLSILSMAVLSIIVMFLYDFPRVRRLSGESFHVETKASFPLLKECFPLLCYLLLSTAVASVPRIIMERMLGNYELGIYGSIAAPTVVVQMGASYIFNPFMTLFAEQYAEGKRKDFWNTFRKCVLGIGVLSLICILGGLIFGKLGLRILYGEEVEAYAYLLLPLIISTVLTAFVWMLCGLLTVVRDFGGLIVSNALALAVSCLGTWMFTDSMGMQGTTVAVILALVLECICLFVRLILCIRHNS